LVAELGGRRASPASSVGAPSSPGQACGKSARGKSSVGAPSSPGLAGATRGAVAAGTCLGRRGRRWGWRGLRRGRRSSLGAADALGPKHRGWGSAVVVSRGMERKQFRREWACGRRPLAVSGPLGGGIFRASSARPRSEARFEVLSRARLRAVFGVRWAVPDWTDPT
jgi:hypothetical protein